MDELDDLIAELDQFGEELERVTEVTLTDLANELPNQLKAKIFAEKQDRTGTLRNSISATVEGNKLVFGMVYYGYFQTFGVTGTERGSFGLSPVVSANFDNKERFQFTKIKHPGIFGVKPAVDLLNSIDDLIIEALIEE